MRPPQHVVDGQHARARRRAAARSSRASAGRRARAPPRGSRHSSPSAHDPRADAARSATSNVRRLAPEAGAGRGRLAVDERGQLEVGPLRRERRASARARTSRARRLRPGRGTAGRGRPLTRSALRTTPPVGGLRGGAAGGSARRRPRIGRVQRRPSARPANALALDRRGGLHRARGGAAAPAARAARRPARAASRRSQPPRAATASSASSSDQQRGQQRRQQRPRVGAEHRPPAVALEAGTTCSAPLANS